MIALALPIFSGNSPDKLFLDRASTDRLSDSKRRGGREPESWLSERIMEPRSISASHKGKLPSSLFSLKSRKFRSFCKEIHSGTSPTSPLDFNDSRESMDFGCTVLTLLFQVIKLPPISKSTSPFISNNHIGTCPSNFRLTMECGISPKNLLPRMNNFCSIFSSPISSGSSPVRELLSSCKNLKFPRNLTSSVRAPPSELLLMSRY